MEIDPATLSPSDRYKLLIGGIVPRPIAFVTSLDPSGRVNLAPYSFFAGVGSRPMTLLFCPSNRPDGEPKDTLRNVLPLTDGGGGEFVVNTAVEGYAREVSAAAEPLPAGESEAALTGLELVPSATVRPPRLARTPLAYECRTRQVIRLAPGEPGGANVVIGDVVHVFVQDELLNERYHIDPESLRAIGRMGGLTYCRTRDRFDLPRGVGALRVPPP